MEFLLVDLLRHVELVEHIQPVDGGLQRRAVRGSLRGGTLQPLAQRLEQDLAYGQTAIALVSPFDHHPRRFRRAGLA